MSNTINLTPGTITAITDLINEKADEIGYDINVPRDAKDALNKGAALAWTKVLEFEMQYVDDLQDDHIVTTILDEVEVNVDSLIAANDAYQIEQFFLPNGEGKPLSLQDFQVGLYRAVMDDLKSAWMDVIRRAVEEVHGEDPLGGNDGLTFPASD